MPAECRVGIVGAGGIVRQRHLPGLRELAGVEIVAVANSTEASARRFVAECAPDARPVADWSALVEDPAIDIVWIGAHPNLHEPVTIAALRAGKHVFCQARMARDLAEAERMLAASDERPDLVTMLCPPPFGLRQDAHIRELLANAIGEPRALRLVSRNGLFLDPNAPAHWRQRREISGKNVMTLGIYTEVLQRWFGDISSLSATGEIRTPIRQGYDVTIPEQLTVRAKFATGLDGILEFSNIHDGPVEESLNVTGSAGTLAVDFASESIQLTRGGATAELDTPTALSRPWQVERDFIDAVRNPDAQRPHPTFRDGLAYMRVVEAVEVARLTGKAVAVQVPN